MTIDRKTLFDIEFTAITQIQAVQTILDWVATPAILPKRVVTPNVNLTVLQKHNSVFRNVLNTSDLCLVDGKPIYWASRWFKKKLPEVVTGSDLVPAIFTAYQASPRTQKLRVFLLGAAKGVAQTAAQKIMAEFSSVQVCDHYSPPMGFENDAAECDFICQRILESNADLLVIGLGSPKQELWAHQFLHRTGVKVAICAGATIDFMAGEKVRAPLWMRKSGLEFAFRIMAEPKRLTKRYLKDSLALPSLFWTEYRQAKKSKDYHPM